MARLTALLVLTALTASVAAAPAVAQDQPEKAKQEKKPKRNPDVITMDEIDDVRNQVSNGMEIVQRLRPTFLRTRGATTMMSGSSANATPRPRVVLDGSPHGDVETLRQISAISIMEIRYLSGTNASTKYGTDYGGGAILVTTRR